MATSSVRGRNANPVFKGLGEAQGYPKWNFNKYVVSAEGEVVAHFGSRVGPSSPELLTLIDEVTAAVKTLNPPPVSAVTGRWPSPFTI